MIERVLTWRANAQSRAISFVKRHPRLLAAARHAVSGGFCSRLSRDPLNPALHLDYALYAARKGRPYLAFAELKTAEYLGADRQEIARHTGGIRGAIPPAIRMDHNQYFRTLTLARALEERSGPEPASVLDVGGGQGHLAAFIPEMRYCLAEPTINGISGVQLPFADGAFDYVVSCHVLEHVDPLQRGRFLDQLVAKSRRGVVLLNPFHMEATSVEERIRLFVDVTGAEWAKEHLDCSLPRLEDIERYAEERHMRIEIKPSGTMATTTAMVFVDYFARVAGRTGDLARITELFNTRYIDILDSPEYPIAHLVYLAKPAA